MSSPFFSVFVVRALAPRAQFFLLLDTASCVSLCVRARETEPRPPAALVESPLSGARANTSISMCMSRSSLRSWGVLVVPQGPAPYRLDVLVALYHLVLFCVSCRCRCAGHCACPHRGVSVKTVMCVCVPLRGEWLESWTPPIHIPPALILVSTAAPPPASKNSIRIKSQETPSDKLRWHTTPLTDRTPTDRSARSRLCQPRGAR